MPETKPSYTFNKLNRYMTRGIQNDLPFELQFLIWSCVDELVESATETDYLQVFKLERKDGIYYLTHTQEQPPYMKVHKLKNLESFDMRSDMKIYVIDDITHSTMLFASEY